MRLSYPVLGLAYSKGHVLVCGGGGSSKNGMTNTLNVYSINPIPICGNPSKANDPLAFTKLIECDTGKDLISGVCTSLDGSLVATSVGPLCWLFQQKSSNDEKTVEVILKFRTDFADYDSDQTTIAFVGNSTLLTGGQDGVVRVWDILLDTETTNKTAVALDAAVAPTDMPVGQPENGDEAIHQNCIVRLARQYKGHTRRIKAIAVDSFSRNLIASSSEDQSCQLWRLIDGKCIWNLRTDVLNLNLQQRGLKIEDKSQFRCIKFAPDGLSLFTVLSPPRGNSYVAKWVPKSRMQMNDDEWEWIPQLVAPIFPEPVASLAISQDSRYIAVGSASGFVHVYLASTFQFHHSCLAHDFAVTGLQFVSQITKENELVTFYLISSSADKKMYCHYIPMTGSQSLVFKIGNLVNQSILFLTSLTFGVISFIICLLLGILCLHTNSEYFKRNPLLILEDILSSNTDSLDVHASAILIAISFVVASIFTVWNIKSSSSIMKASSFGWLINSVLVFSFLIPAIYFPQPTWTIPGIDQDDELATYVIGVCSGGITLLFLVLYILCNALS